MPTTKVANERHETMAALYRKGSTLKEIGDQHGITRERVRQILSRMGVNSQEGGKAYKTRRRKKAAALKRERRFLRKYGMTPERLKEVQKNTDDTGATPLFRFTEQKGNAGYRGIEWNLTFDQWWSLWEKSGQWSSRGRGKGSYVMARFGDEGPYEIGNVEIIRFEENNRDYINRYWAEVHSGKRRRPAQYDVGPRNSRYGFHLLVDQDRVVVEDEKTRNVQRQALNYAKTHGWKVKTKITGDRVTIQRVS